MAEDYPLPPLPEVYPKCGQLDDTFDSTRDGSMLPLYDFRYGFFQGIYWKCNRCGYEVR